MGNSRTYLFYISYATEQYVRERIWETDALTYSILATLLNSMEGGIYGKLTHILSYIVATLHKSMEGGTYGKREMKWGALF